MWEKKNIFDNINNAANEGHLEVVRLLLERGAIIEAKDNVS